MSTAADGPATSQISAPPSPSPADWSKLPDEILAAVRLLVSLRDRVRLAAACRAWRASPRDPAEPAVPLLLLLHPSDSDRQIRGGVVVVPGADDPGRKRVYSPEDGGGLFDLPIPCGRVVGAHEGGWLAVACLGVLSVLNPFSSAPGGRGDGSHDVGGLLLQVPLEFGVCKVVFSDAPTTSSISGFVLAAITGDRLSVALRRAVAVAVAGEEEVVHGEGGGGGWTRHRVCVNGAEEEEKFTIADIAFCNGGDLYALCGKKRILKLFKISVSANRDELRVAAARQVGEELDTGAEEDDDDDEKRRTPYHARRTTRMRPARYLVNLRGVPAVAALARWAPGRREPSFKVFELDTTGDGNGGCGWAEAKVLGGDYALFVGPACSRAAEVGGDMRRDAVYYSGYRRSGARRREEEDDDDTGVKEEGNRIASVGYYIGNGALGGTWILRPADLPLPDLRARCLKRS